MRRSGCVVGVLIALLVPTPAHGHGDLEGTDPEEGAKLGRPPSSVSVTLSEAPGQGSTMKVTDGCKDDVVVNVAGDGAEATLQARVRGGQPGRWSVRYRAISSVDGHLTRGAYAFRVNGKKDCSEPNDDGADDTDIAGGRDTRVDNPNPPDEGSFPVLPFAAGTVAVAALAFVIRRVASR